MARKKKNNISPAAKDKAALYTRVSTVYQIGKDSLKVQERELIYYTQLVLNMDDYEIFWDAGYSAKNTDRPDYQRMMQKLRTGEFSHLVVWKIDRISRNLLDFAEMYAELKDLGVTFVSKNEQFDTSSAIGEAMLKIILVFAELERQMTSERVTAVMISRAESGSWNGGKVPLGYVYDKETKSFGVHPEQAEVVKLIYDSYERMQSSTAVAKFLNEKGITTKAGNKWSPSTACLILRNPVYKGTMVYNKRRISVTGKLKPKDEWVTIENHHTAIIDAEQFERCPALLKKNRIGSDRSTYFRGNCHVLAGLLYCDYCGSMMAAQIGKPLKSKGGIIPSNYSCYNKRHGLCENPFTSDSMIDPFILNYVANMYRIQRTFGKATSIETLEKKLLRGGAFKEVDHIEANGLIQPYQALKNQIFADNPVFYELNLPEHEAAPDQKAIYLNEEASHERALHRLHQLFMYADSDMSETDYFAEKSKLEAKINDITQKLAQLESEETSDVSSEYFTALVSNFILENSLNEERYIDYFALKKKIDPMELKLFLNAVLSKCYIRQGRVASIIKRLRAPIYLQEQGGEEKCLKQRSMCVYPLLLDKESRGVQKNDLIRYCEDILGVVDYEIFEDAGFSAGSTDRPDYQDMMRRIRTGEFTHLIVWKIDRISRNIIDFTEMFEELHMLDVTFISLAEQFDTSSIVGQGFVEDDIDFCGTGKA